jgi:hypothetical protein
MRAFHEREYRTYVGAILVLDIISFLANLQAGTSGIGSWAAQNAMVFAMLPMAILPLLSRNRWVQLLCPVLLLVESFAYLIIYYPTLSLGGST